MNNSSGNCEHLEYMNTQTTTFHLQDFICQHKNRHAKKNVSSTHSLKELNLNFTKLENKPEKPIQNPIEFNVLL